MSSIDFSQAPSWLQWLLAVAAVLAFVGGGIRAIPPAWRFVTRFVSTVNELAELPRELTELRKFRSDTALTLSEQNTTLAKQDRKIAEIHHEVNFNNGSSAKDAIIRIEKGVAGLYEEIDALKQEDADIRRDFENTQPHPPKEKS